MTKKRGERKKDEEEKRGHSACRFGMALFLMADGGCPLVVMRVVEPMDDPS